MRIAIITESFLPTVNGVSNSVARVTEQLERRGHEVLIVAPGRGPARFSQSRVVRTPAIPLPGYHSIPVGIPGPSTLRAVIEFDPDVVHLAGPIALGAWGMSVARRIRRPSVAVYQTDFPRYTGHYRVGGVESLAWSWLRRLHGEADVTLAPSTSAARDLRENGIPRVRIWGRGVDAETFNPCHRDPDLRQRLAPDGQLLVGYVGRLAPEKGVGALRALLPDPRIRLVVVGDGPDRSQLERHLPGAVFTGHQDGPALSRLFASLDLFVHTGVHETFCQTIQEALASGVPVVAPAVGGPVDLVDHCRTGLLVPPNDPLGLRVAVGGLADNRGRLRALAANARPSVEGRDWSVVTAELDAHYRRACGWPETAADADRVTVAVGGR